jgi:UDP-glucose 4-epimerase
MIILVTGATGLLGTNLVQRLRQDGHKVYEASRKLKIDLADSEFTQKFVELTKPDVIYHLAANAAESRGQVAPIDMTQRNIGIFVNTLKAAINCGVKRFIYTSSAAVYGEVEVPYKEDGETKPVDVYGVNKLACEMILKIMAKVYKMDYVIFRPHNLYGPHQNMNDPYRNVVALFMRRLLEGKPYKLYGEGKMKRAFSYVDDVVDVLVDGLSERFTNKTVNVGSDMAISIRELSDLVQEVTGYSLDPEMVPARKQEISMFLADHTLQHSLTTYKNTSILEGLEKTWEWVKKNELGEVETQPNEINV